MSRILRIKLENTIEKFEDEDGVRHEAEINDNSGILYVWRNIESKGFIGGRYAVAVFNAEEWRSVEDERT